MYHIATNLLRHCLAKSNVQLHSNRPRPLGPTARYSSKNDAKSFIYSICLSVKFCFMSTFINMLYYSMRSNCLPSAAHIGLHCFESCTYLGLSVNGHNASVTR